MSVKSSVEKHCPILYAGFETTLVTVFSMARWTHILQHCSCYFVCPHMNVPAHNHPATICLEKSIHKKNVARPPLAILLGLTSCYFVAKQNKVFGSPPVIFRHCPCIIDTPNARCGSPDHPSTQAFTASVPLHFCLISSSLTKLGVPPKLQGLAYNYAEPWLSVGMLRPILQNTTIWDYVACLW